MKLTGIVLLAIVSLTNDLPNVQAAQNLLQVSQQVRLPKLQGSGAPRGRRRGGTSRNGCPALSTPITALVPGQEADAKDSNSFLAATVAEYPTFWIYVPDLAATVRSGEFVLQDQRGNDVYRSPISLPEKAGIISVRLPSDPKYALAIDQPYQWYFRIYCNQSATEYFYVDAWIQRVALTPELETQLKTSSRSYSVYTTNDLWYDALTDLATLRSTSPSSTAIATDWTKLLQSVGLQDLAGAPIVPGYGSDRR